MRVHTLTVRRAKSGWGDALWAVVALAIACLPASGWAQAPLVAAPAMPLEQMLRADGSIDLQGGYRGSVSAEGWKLVSGPGEAPRFERVDSADALRQPQPAAGLATTADPADDFWDSRFSIWNGNEASCFAMDGSGNLYAGSYSGYLAKWNGSTWSSLDSGVNGYVFALAVDANGNLYAGGTFSNAGGVPASNIAKWNGTAWSALGLGTNSHVTSLAVDVGGNLYAGGWFTTAGTVPASYVAKWNGTIWSALGSGIDNGVDALAVDGSGNLYAGGLFTAAGGLPASGVAKWNGTTWSALGAGFDGGVNALTVDGSGNLYAANGLSSAEGAPPLDVFKWNGAAWVALGSGINWGLNDMVMDSDGNLWAAGWSVNAEGEYALNIAKWNGTTWSAISPGTVTSVNALAMDASGHPYLGGGFTTVTGVNGYGIVHWNGTTWSTLGQGMEGAVVSVVTDGNGNVYVGGWFTVAGNVPASNIAKWDGENWSALGAGLDNGVNAMALDGSGNLYAGGWFSTAGGVPAAGVAKWDGTTWSALGTGLMYGGGVFALALDHDGHLYAGGWFEVGWGAPASYVARWDGTAWSPLGSGVDYVVSCLTIDGHGDLIAGGSFSTAGGVPASGIARWNGTTWSALGSGMIGSVISLVMDWRGDIYAAGHFTMADGGPAANIARWNGISWSGLGSGMYAYGMDGSFLNALAVDGSGNLYAGGRFDLAGGVNAANIAKWNGVSWSALGSGVNDDVYALASDGNGNLYVGGYFTTTGGKPSGHFGVWHESCPSLAAHWIGDYAPALPGMSWAYRNVDQPSLTYRESVFEQLVYEGHPAVKTGRPESYEIVSNSARVLTVYAMFDGGVLQDLPQDLVLGRTTDGTAFGACGGAGCDMNLIRDWDAIDPALRAAFGLDADYGDLVLFASYDTNYPPNSQNLVVESNLPVCAARPTGAVTGLQWFRRGVGMVAFADVEAAFGTLRDFYKLADPSAGVDDRPRLPATAMLAQNTPNPFNPRTAIRYDLPAAGPVRLSVFDLAGRLVRTLVDESMPPGSHEAVWDGRDSSGRVVGSGSYLARLSFGGRVETVRMGLVR